jgi:hypothetical protein
VLQKRTEHLLRNRTGINMRTRNRGGEKSRGCIMVIVRAMSFLIFIYSKDDCSNMQESDCPNRIANSVM